MNESKIKDRLPEPTPSDAQQPVNDRPATAFANGVLDAVLISEGNKLIDEIFAFGIEPIPSRKSSTPIVGFDYHSDMNRLSMVCNYLKKFYTPREGKSKTYTGCCKLSISLDFEGNSHICEARIYGSLDLWIGDNCKEFMTPHIHNKHIDPCMALWLTIVDFIKWYKQNAAIV